MLMLVIVLMVGLSDGGDDIPVTDGKSDDNGCIT